MRQILILCAVVFSCLIYADNKLDVEILNVSESLPYKTAYTLPYSKTDRYEIVSWRDDSGITYSVGETIIIEGPIILYANWTGRIFNIIYKKYPNLKR